MLELMVIVCTIFGVWSNDVNCLLLSTLMCIARELNIMYNAKYGYMTNWEGREKKKGGDK